MIGLVYLTEWEDKTKIRYIQGTKLLLKKLSSILPNHESKKSSHKKTSESGSGENADEKIT